MKIQESLLNNLFVPIMNTECFSCDFFHETEKIPHSVCTRDK